MESDVNYLLVRFEVIKLVKTQGKGGKKIGIYSIVKLGNQPVMLL